MKSILGLPLHYWSVFRSYYGRGKSIGLVLLTVMNSFFDSLGILMLMPLLSMGRGGHPDQGTGFRDPVTRVLHLLGVEPNLQILIFLLVSFFLLKGVVNFFAEDLRASAINQIARACIQRLLQAYSGMSYPYFITTSTGSLTSNITTHSNRFGTSFSTLISTSSFAISVVVYVAFSLWVDFKFTLLAFASASIAMFLMRKLTTKSRQLSQFYTKSQSFMYRLLVQNLNHFKYLLSTSHTGLFRKQVYEASVDNLRYQLQIAQIRALTTSITDPVIVTLLGMILYFHVKFLGGEISSIAVTAILLQRTMKQLLGLQQVWQSFLANSGSVDLVQDELSKVTQNQEVYGSRHYPGFSRDILLDEVSFAYRDKLILDRMRFSVPKNSTIALVGASGAGKSTLVDLLTGVLTPNAGQVRIDGVPMRDYDLTTYRSRIGYVVQEPVVFDDSAANNISLWKHDPGNSTHVGEIRAAARAAHCAEFIEQLPQGYDTVLGEKGVTLSIGQRQRLAIARELYKKPDLLLLDEATSALDSESERFIQASIDQLKGSVTIVIIAHRLSTVKRADRICVLSNGKIIEEGTFQELVGRPSSVFKRMCELQTLQLDGEA